MLVHDATGICSGGNSTLFPLSSKRAMDTKQREGRLNKTLHAISAQTKAISFSILFSLHIKNNTCSGIDSIMRALSTASGRTERNQPPNASPSSVAVSSSSMFLLL